MFPSLLFRKGKVIEDLTEHDTNLRIFQVSWAEAQDFCRRTGGRMASVENKNFVLILDYAIRRNLTTDVWLGGKYENSTWKWADHKEIEENGLLWALT